MLKCATAHIIKPPASTLLQFILTESKTSRKKWGNFWWLVFQNHNWSCEEAANVMQIKDGKKSKSHQRFMLCLHLSFFPPCFSHKYRYQQRNKHIKNSLFLKTDIWGIFQEHITSSKFWKNEYIYLFIVFCISDKNRILFYNWTLNYQISVTATNSGLRWFKQQNQSIWHFEGLMAS